MNINFIILSTYQASSPRSWVRVPFILLPTLLNLLQYRMQYDPLYDVWQIPWIFNFLKECTVNRFRILTKTKQKQQNLRKVLVIINLLLLFHFVYVQASIHITHKCLIFNEVTWRMEHARLNKRF